MVSLVGSLPFDIRTVEAETIDQDISLLARVQAGARSSGFDRAWLSDQEIRVAHFHDALNETYREAGLLED